jgi:adenosylcobinamide-GDP ribazoletransferase
MNTPVRTKFKRLKEFETALGFLTVLRTPNSVCPDMADVGHSAWAFPLVGATVGVILLFAHWLLFLIWPPLPASVILVIIWIVLTGGLHMDGWADCCDALPMAKDPGDRRAALKDPRIGSFAALGLIAIVAVKISAIYSLQPPAIGILVAAVLGRSMMVIAALRIKPADSGMAAGFIGALDTRVIMTACLIIAPLLLLELFKVAFSVIICSALALGLGKMAQKRLGGVNGDVLGAMCELSEAVALIIFVAGLR